MLQFHIGLPGVPRLEEAEKAAVWLSSVRSAMFIATPTLEARPSSFRSGTEPENSS